MTLSVGIRSRLFKKLDTMFVLIHTMLLKEQGRLLSDWLICYPSAQTLFKRAALNLKNKDGIRRSDFMLTLHYCLLKSFRKMLEAFYFVLLFRMAGNCWVIKLKRFEGYRSRFYWQGTVSLVASSASCCHL